MMMLVVILFKKVSKHFFYPSKFGDFFKIFLEIRKALGLNQKDFSERLGLAQGSYSSIETGTITLTEKNIKFICMSFNVNENWLRTGIGAMFTSQSPKEAKFLEVFRELLPENQEYILEVLNKFLETQEKLLGKIKPEALPDGVV